MRVLRWLVVLLALGLAVLVFRPGPEGSGDAHHDERIARVVRVVDGDTVKVEIDGRSDRVRYIGIDTPETVKPGAPVQCFGHQASAQNTVLVQGRDVRLVPGEEPRDRYGRLLAYVYRVSDGAFVNAALVRGGYARTLTIPPNDRYAGQFGAFQAQARSARRGLWGAC